MPMNGNRPGEGAAHSVGKPSKASENTSTPAPGASCTRAEVAAFILRAAAAVDLRIGSDGCDLVLAPPRGMPSASFLSFRRAILEYRDEIIDYILGEATP
jgi:hypothetical protein